MAFCTTCGATVDGNFCNRCGTPAGNRAAAAPPPVPVPPPAGAPAKRKTSPIVWVLLVVGCLFGLGLLGALGTGLFFFNKARQAGVDSQLFARDPGQAVARMIAAFNPEMEVLSTDQDAGVVRLRNRRTNQEVTMNLDDARRGVIRFSAEDEQGKTATLEIGGDGKVPSWVPDYPHAEDAKPVFVARGDSGGQSGEAGSVSFTTTDSPDQVIAFYQSKAEEMGMKVQFKASSSDGGTVVGVDHDTERTLTAIVSGGHPTTVNVAYSRKR
jgi:hypothetical protein